MPNSTDDRLLTVYLHDHLASAIGGVELANRVAKAHADSPIGPALDRLARDIEQDRDSLREILGDLGMPDPHVHDGLTWLAEKEARLQQNGQLVGHSPLSSLIELESLRIALEGKRAGWVTLRLLADHDKRLDPGRLNELIARGIDQAHRAEELRRVVARTAFRTDTSQEA